MSEGRSSRLIGIVLAVLAPCGTGHYYVGLSRRAVFWFALPSLALLTSAVLVAAGSGTFRLCAFCVFLAFATLGWVGPIVDLALVKSSRFIHIPFLKVLFFAVIIFAAGTILRTAVRAGVLEAFKIPPIGGAMGPTLLPQDAFLVDKLYYGRQIPLTSRRLLPAKAPAIGDVIVFEYLDVARTSPRQDFTSRVMATSGDRLEFDDGHPLINGWRVPNCLVGQHKFDFGHGVPQQGTLFVEYLGNAPYLTWFQDGAGKGKEGPYVVQPGEIWVVGDNRNNSSDSRYWNGGLGGGVPIPSVKGHASFVWLSFRADGFISWSRVGHDIEDIPLVIAREEAQLGPGIRECLSRRPSQTFPPGHTQP